MPKLTRPPHLAPHLAKGALTSPRKRPPYKGARLPPDEVTLVGAAVDPARLRAYNAVCRFRGGATLPPTYPHIMAFPLAMRLMAAADFPFPLLGLIHTGITVTCPVPLPVTARPTLTVHAEGVAPHRKGTEFTVVTGAELDGTTVWHSRSTYLCPHRTRESAARDTARGEEPAGLPARAAWDLPADLGRRYAAASGDRNPIHLHPLTARLFGFPRPIAHGMWTFARCLAELDGDSEGGGGGKGGELTEARAVFKAPVPLPATVTFGADGTGAFALRGEEPHGGRSRTHLSGHVERASSGGPSSGSPAPPSRSS
ncbi:MaoC family dehydratase [Streptomyces iconiensis]|uniref:MaoC/PaaZ C-terminal domain-containing protein n=1 Tax=Streptomyces iconiensis TaxID=1384038 RepID=A0ABT6ZXL0_9ACTN|nr:MaoC/PaaZ C-terminal domain-containing protein [Streptomyces iconiensis]MDJ1133808.1 MaoC/PaaZ C-terminal domain-containing protein [Streptomyces iconiensis]